MDVVVWSTIEIYTALICASIMCLRPLAAKLLPVLFKIQTTAATRETPFSDESNKDRIGVAGKLYRGNFGIKLSDSDIRAARFNSQNSNNDGWDGDDIHASNIELAAYHKEVEPSYKGIGGRR